MKNAIELNSFLAGIFAEYKPGFFEDQCEALDAPRFIPAGYATTKTVRAIGQLVTPRPGY